ncbi:transcriptional activator of acetoin/glycerol metabolism [Arthrobacter crystallopoietes BAB-32]|uniref:Transcriptional activator of acetoin/glycerol metabolism n=1 Tax=Arthrobacter crystallopoietes BAB-32 TaxID=1246476 RepID=N1UY92_9MICC|nr:transcriptional activator of acetoin/glycerol metabolism [Arthrobacter crystallopoietes BAB-32]
MAALPDPSLRFTAPHEYARVLRAAHEQVLDGGPHRPEIPPALLASWQRSMTLGINPDQQSPRHLNEPSDVVGLRRTHRLQAAMPALTDLLADEGSDGRHLLIVTDSDGQVLWRSGSRSALRMADSLEFVEGADWSEAGIGTNAISEALATGRPVQLFSAEHLVRAHHDWACTAAPVRDPRTGSIVGVLDVSGPLDALTRDTMRMVRCAVRVAEELVARNDGGARLSPAAVRPGSGSRPDRGGGQDVAVSSLELLGERPAAVFEDGRRVPLTLRRAEILALLESRRQGWSADELAFELYGDAGSPATIRIEMHRIRAALGAFVASNPYRLKPGSARTSDAFQVRELLTTGHIQQAVARYTAPLLSRSAMLAVEELRLELDTAVADSVRASGSVDVLAAWLATDMGAGDTEALAALKRLVGPDDPRYLAFRPRSDRLERSLLEARPEKQSRKA